MEKGRFVASKGVARKALGVGISGVALNVVLFFDSLGFRTVKNHLGVKPVPPHTPMNARPIKRLEENALLERTQYPTPTRRKARPVVVTSNDIDLQPHGVSDHSIHHRPPVACRGSLMPGANHFLFKKSLILPKYF